MFQLHKKIGIKKIKCCDKLLWFLKLKDYVFSNTKFCSLRKKIENIIFTNSNINFKDAKVLQK